jgi:hypothetical protein
MHISPAYGLQHVPSNHTYSHKHSLFLKADEDKFKHEETCVKQQFRLKQIGKTQFKRHTIVDLLQVISQRAPNHSTTAFVFVGDSTLRLGRTIFATFTLLLSMWYTIRGRCEVEGKFLHWFSFDARNLSWYSIVLSLLILYFEYWHSGFHFSDGSPVRRCKPVSNTSWQFVSFTWTEYHQIYIKPSPCRSCALEKVKEHIAG